MPHSGFPGAPGYVLGHYAISSLINPQKSISASGNISSHQLYRLRPGAVPPASPYSSSLFPYLSICPRSLIVGLQSRTTDAIVLSAFPLPWAPNLLTTCWLMSLTFGSSGPLCHNWRTCSLDTLLCLRTSPRILPILPLSTGPGISQLTCFSRKSSHSLRALNRCLRTFHFSWVLICLTRLSIFSTTCWLMSLTSWHSVPFCHS